MIYHAEIFNDLHTLIAGHELAAFLAAEPAVTVYPDY
jgi:hypothetical protein